MSTTHHAVPAKFLRLPVIRPAQPLHLLKKRLPILVLAQLTTPLFGNSRK